MNTLDIFLLCVPVSLLITWRLLTGSTHQHRDERRANESLTGGDAFARKKNIGHRHSLYEAKRFRLCNNPCHAALQQRNQSFLAVEAPPLPLPECDRKGACHCEYSTHNDRRSGHDRRYPAEDIVPSDNLVLSDSAVTTRDRREKKDRRRASGRAKRPTGISS